MPLIPLSGSYRASSSLPEIDRTYLAGDVTIGSPDTDQMLAIPYVADTVHNSGVVAEQVFHEYHRLLATKMDGFVIVVAYYTKFHAGGLRSVAVSTINEDGPASAYTRINDMQIKMLDPLSGEYDFEDPQTRITTNIVFYPGFVPRLGDFFLYRTAAEQLGYFAITKVQPLSYRNGTAYGCEVQMMGFVGQDQIAEIEAQVGEQLFFQEEAFFNGRSPLLVSDEKILLDDVRNMYSSLVTFYCDQFFNQTWARTFIRPTDETYDPYIVEFLDSVVEWSQMPFRPKRLMDLPADYADSYWAQLLNPNALTYGLVPRYYARTVKRTMAASTVITSLVNRSYVYFCDEDTLGAEAYIAEGLDPAAEEATDFELMTRMWLELHKVDPTGLLAMCTEYRSIDDPMDQFYHIPVMLYLLRLTEQYIVKGILHESIASTEDFVPTRYEFTEESLSIGWLTIGSPNTVLGVLDENGVMFTFADNEVVYQNNIIQIDIGTFCDRLEKTVTGIWTVVLSGINTNEQ